jgi:hypothetical protein
MFQELKKAVQDDPDRLADSVFENKKLAALVNDI